MRQGRRYRALNLWAAHDAALLETIARRVERGTNENTNGLLRQYLPKGTCLSHLTRALCDAIAAKLNHRPRRRLNFRTPHEVYYGSVRLPRRQVASCGKPFGSCPRKRPIGYI